MPCARPIPAYWSKTRNPATGLRFPVFNLRDGLVDRPLRLPCQQCIFCRLNNSREKAIRCVHEASLYEQNCFLTLTYAPEHLPHLGSLDYSHPVGFMKRLRKRFSNVTIRSFGCGEYGEKLSRPHYHILLFNFDFPDKKFLKSYRGNRYYTSEILSRLWWDKKTKTSLGHAIIGALTFESAAYVGRYVTKKITGPRAQDYYQRLDEYGEYQPIEKEKPICVSLKPGIGAPWLKKYMRDTYPSDSVIIRGKEVKPPKYYDKLFAIDNPEEFLTLKQQRKNSVQKCGCLLRCHCYPENATPERMSVRETIQLIKAENLKRPIET